MTMPADSALALVSFGDGDGRLWGAALQAGEAAVVAVDVGDFRITGGPERTTLSTEAEEWRLTAQGVELSIAPMAAGSAAATGELCRVEGHVVRDGAEHTIDARGVRSRGPVPDGRELESLRGVWSWFEDAHVLAVIAARPAGAAGQESDRVTATLFEAAEPITVHDPRLSTTYGAHGLPARMGLELWVGDGDEQYPRRAAGEPLGPGEELSNGAMTVRILPLRCHSAGHDGPGVYLLARF
jgi:hypothetical protein